MNNAHQQRALEYAQRNKRWELLALYFLRTNRIKWSTECQRMANASASLSCICLLNGSK